MTREHVSSQFHAELAEIRTLLLEMGGEVEHMILNSVHSLVTRDCTLAEKTIAREGVIEFLELAIDQKCVTLLARRQPAARDLRFVTLALKIVTDLERIGDHSARIAEHALALNRELPLKHSADLPQLAESANRAVRQALDAFVRADTTLAAKVCREDCQVDQLNEQLERDLLALMVEDASSVPRAVRVNSIAKYLERIADHATNIAEMVIFMVEGKDIRHANGANANAPAPLVAPA